MSSLNVCVAGIEMSNPLMLASGIMGETAGSLLRIAASGAGAVVTKSIGMEPREGYPNPTLVELPFGYLNGMGLPNPGIEAFIDELLELGKADIPVIGSIFGSEPDEFALLAGKMEEAGASAVELNLSCPHARGYGMEVGVDPSAVRRIVERTSDEVDIPVLAKLTPNTHRLCEVALAVQEGGGDGVVAINTLKAMVISVEARAPVLSNKIGGLSGPAIKPVGVRCVWELYKTLDIPVIGVGGIESYIDVLEYIMAGATAVQIGSAVGRKGPEIFRKISKKIEEYLRQNGFKSIVELVGIAHEGQVLDRDR